MRFTNIVGIHQGEHFSATLSAEFLQMKSSTKIWVAEVELHDDCKLATFDVIMKVSSLAVHDTLVTPLMAAFAIQGLMSCSVLAETLLCVWYPSDTTLVTAMQNLATDGYHNLKPCAIPNLYALWLSFCDLVKRVLIPLAQNGMVHCDIWLGWDYTSNIMVRMEMDGSLSCD